MKFLRDPQWYLTVFAAMVMFLSAYVFHWSTDVQGWLNAAAVAIVGFIVAVQTHDGQLAALVGMMKALIALGLAFGLKLNPEQQVALMAVVMAVGSGFVRTQVAAKVLPPPEVLPQVRFDGSAGASLR